MKRFRAVYETPEGYENRMMRFIRQGIRDLEEHLRKHTRFEDYLNRAEDDS